MTFIPDTNATAEITKVKYIDIYIVLLLKLIESNKLYYD